LFVFVKRQIDRVFCGIKKTRLLYRTPSHTPILSSSIVSSSKTVNPSYRAIDDALRLGESRGASIHWWNATKTAIVSRWYYLIFF